VSRHQLCGTESLSCFVGCAEFSMDKAKANAQKKAKPDASPQRYKLRPAGARKAPDRLTPSQFSIKKKVAKLRAWRNLLRSPKSPTIKSLGNPVKIPKDDRQRVRSHFAWLLFPRMFVQLSSWASAILLAPLYQHWLSR
jgi:hypothetical protein